MPQIQLPFFPEGVTHITPMLAFRKENGQVTYFNGNMPVFVHDEGDLATFRMITAQFCVNGNTKQAEIAKVFGIPLVTVKRAVKLYRQAGPKGFYAPRKTRGAVVLTALVLAEAQGWLDEGLTPSVVAERLGIKPDTLSKAVRAGRLHPRAKKKDDAGPLSSKSARSAEDSVAPMGRGASAVEARTAASLGALTAVAPDFKPALDLPKGGVLSALPALLAVGLLAGSERFFALPKGYYGLDSLFLLLAFMALARLKSVESLRSVAPGEWGKLLGLDRIPEVRTLRHKIQLLAQDHQPAQWGAELCRQWMAAAPEAAGILYIDGHVRVYHGSQTQLPRHYVARQKLCLRATCDYWVNAMDGQPFFVIQQAVDPGLIQVIEQDILPRLHQDVPGQPSTEELAADPLRHRFTLVFDRAGYSPDFLKRMKDQRVACLTYHKYPGADWAEDEFQAQPVKLANGQIVEMKLAERGTRLSNGLWVREFRKLTERGHQTALLATDYRAAASRLAPALFARWSQENFFKYARQHFNLDRLVDYGAEPLADTLKVVNPAYRRLDGQVRSATGKLHRLLAQFGAMSLDDTIEPEQVEPFMQKKAALQETIDLLQQDVQTAKDARKATPKHVKLSELPEAERFQQLSTQSKYLIDTIKMIAYRAETAMANLVREHLSRPDEARSLLQALYQTEADLLPDYDAGILTVRLHHLANASLDAAVQKLFDELNQTETLFPRTNLRLILKLGSS